MNQYQRLGTFIVRIAGSVLLLVGVIGVVYAVVVEAGLVPPSSRASMAVSTVWLGFGLVLLLPSNQLGRWLGRGLE